MRKTVWLMGGVAVATAVFLLALTTWMVHHVWIDRDAVPDIEAFIRFDEPTTGAVYATDGPLLIELARERREIVTYEQIPPIVRDAILAAEDRRFFEHRGIDPMVWPRVLLRNVAAVRRAASRFLATGECCRVTLRQGGSTITQQLVRGYFLAHLTERENAETPLSEAWPARIAGRLIGMPAANKLVRKVEEIRLALWLEETLAARAGSHQRAKEMIFTRYANLIYFGSGRYGVAAAAQHYFGTAVDRLGEADAGVAAILAGMIRNPRDYAPNAGNGEAARRRRNEVLTMMRRNGRLNNEATRRAQAAPIELAESPPPPPYAPAVVASVLDELRNSTRSCVDDLLHGRVRVHTTIDSRVQQIATEAVERGLEQYERRHSARAGETQAAVVVLRNADAAVLAEVGGRRIYQGREGRYTDFNRATQAMRQPGSALKPLVYAAALRAGASLDTVLLDEPIDVEGTSAGAVKTIANYDHMYRGPIRLREALAESRNAATVWLARAVGMPSILSTARDLGMEIALPPYLSTALGASEVSLRELANVYRALASGMTAHPHVIERLESAAQEVVYESTERGRAIAIPELPMIQEALRGVVRLPNGTAHSLAGRSFPVSVMGKTGTSNDSRDAVFVGSTYGPDGITVAVWVGRDDFSPLGRGESGGRVALPVFREIMAQVYRPDVLGAAPRMPTAIDRNIDEYVAWQAVMAEADAAAPEALEPAWGLYRYDNAAFSFPTDADDAPAPRLRAIERGRSLCAAVGRGTICIPRASAPPEWRAAAENAVRPAAWLEP